MNKFDEITERIEKLVRVEEVQPKAKWDNDRFQELTDKLDKIAEQPEKPGPAAHQFFMASPPVVPFADRLAQMPPVTFMNETGQYAQIPGLALNPRTHLPAVSFIDNGRPRRNRGRLQ